MLGPEILICEIFFDEDGINFDENVFATTFIPGNCTAHSHEKNILFLTFNLSGDICAFQILTHLDEAFNFKLKIISHSYDFHGGYQICFPNKNVIDINIE